MMFSVLVVLCCVFGELLGSPQRGTGNKNAKFVGDLVDTDHGVGGEVYILNEDTLVIEKFSYDGNGFGVYIHVATEGNNLKQLVKNRIAVPYPTGSQGEAIEDKYEGDGRLVIDLSQIGVKASDVKWLSVWCTVFDLSFGHVLF